MGIVLVGVSHKTAPVELREQLAFDDQRLPLALTQLIEHDAIKEGLILSTCNRIEVIAATPESPATGLSTLFSFLRAFHGCRPEDLERHAYTRSDLDAVKHIFRVTSSLDSMVVGEPQITGQVKEAFQRAQEARAMGSELTRVMSRAFAVAKRIRNETAIGSNAVSISYVAVELARKVFDRLDGSAVMLIGAGEMSELAARHLKTGGAHRILIANRTLESAQRLANEMEGEAIPFSDFESRLAEADIVICSTEAPHYVLSPEAVHRAISVRRNQPMLFIDVSVPRNIDPAIGSLDNVFLFDIDDLENVIAFNRTEREREALRAEAIVTVEAERFASALAEGDVREVISAFRREVGLLIESELERSRRRLEPLSDEQREAVRTLVDSIVNKLTLPVIKQLRESEDGHSRYLEAWRELYHRDR